MISEDEFWQNLWYVCLLNDGKGGIKPIGSYDADKRVEKGYPADPEEHENIYGFDDLGSDASYGYWSYRGDAKLVGIDLDLYKTDHDETDLTFKDGTEDGPLIVESPSGGKHMPVLVYLDDSDVVRSEFDWIDVKGEGADTGYLVLPSPNSDYQIVGDGDRVVQTFTRDEVAEILKVDGTSALAVASKQSSSGTPSHSDAPISVTTVVDVPIEENVSHPFHESSTETNFRVDENDETWRCWRHEVTGNVYHLIGVEAGILECGEWKDADEPYAGKWGQIADYCEDNGYELPDRDDWESIRWQYDNNDIPKYQARSAAVDHLMKDYVFATAKETDVLYVYVEGVYEPEGEIVIKQKLSREIGRHYSRREAEETIHTIKSKTYTELDQFGADETDPKVCVENGVLEFDVSDGFDVSFRDHSPADLFLKKLPVKYDPSADSSTVDEFVHSIVAAENDVAQLYEMIGYSLWPGYSLAQKFMMLHGDGSNGKTIFLQMVESLLGHTSNMSLQRLINDRFAVADLHRSYANISGELPTKKLFDTNTIKALTGGDTVVGERKYESPFTFENKAKFIFSTNEPPVVEDPTHGFARRILLIEFPYQFENDPVKGRELRESLTTDEALSGLLNRSLEGLERVATRGFSQMYTPEELVERYNRISDPIAEFAEDCLENVPSGDVATRFIRKTDVYACYTQWAEAAGRRTKNKQTFYKALERSPAITTREFRPNIDGSRPRCYENMRFSETGKEFVKFD